MITVSILLKSCAIACEADGLHLLRLPELRLRGDLLRQIADEAVEDMPAAPLECRHAQLDLDFLAVAFTRAHLLLMPEDGALPGPPEFADPPG